MEIRGSTVLVTGASRGIGAAMARAFAASGAKVVVAARSKDALERVAADIGGTAVPVDLGDAAAVADLIPRVERDVGPVDILVNNAGLETTQPLASVDPDHLGSVVDVNLKAPILLTRHVLPGMLERGRGHLVYTSSVAGTGGFPTLAAYGATKAGLNNLVAALRIELGATPVKLTLVAPGPVDTDMWDHLADASSVASTLKRLRMLQLIPTTTPERLASRTVKAVAAGRRHVRHPARLSPSFWLGEAPRRLNELVLRGVVQTPIEH